MTARTQGREDSEDTRKLRIREHEGKRIRGLEEMEDMRTRGQQDGEDEVFFFIKPLRGQDKSHGNFKQTRTGGRPRTLTRDHTTSSFGNHEDKNAFVCKDARTR